MADLRCTIAGITSPNPFWLASAPPTDKAYNVNRAFEAGWGGVVWKTLGLDPHVVNVSSRYGAVQWNGQRIAGLNNIELITDRPLDVNLTEIAQVKRDWPDRALIVSLMVPCNERDWKWILPLVEDTGADAVELNFGCPHGMSERGMGAAVGQVPEYVEMVTRWVKEGTKLPCLVKLTPNISDIRMGSRAAYKGGADGVSLINTINSIVAVDLDQMAPMPTVDGKGTHGGYCGPAVKPIALNMVAEIARDPETPNLPISGIGGISSWRDAAEFMVLGAGSVQVCTAAMHYGFRIVSDLADGLSNWMDEKGYATLDDIRGRAVPNVTDWKYLNLKYDIKARIDQDRCIQCGLCHIACEDTSHQAITATKDGVRHFEVIDSECVGCNLCMHVCPVEQCITMERVDSGGYANWTTHPNNPASADAGASGSPAAAPEKHAKAA
ncbi:NAD-dependent dihydropyrimidine dehydrogenase subunit PreA [Burkholderia arboris]|uniref:NAD-dependent dihydropyrimidine dehydrogenase subunit PreA n=1 Tax=Burkholderia arboris TaxID=488730 RepID=UPI001CF5FCF2|nr:NAD-dependent dihydropyrimidine dehydrogenase subunit PreA [Burkholderia arboris]MCA8037250.1 NAD-dependent dihydropyrimidine dehydrogenase subunit PreA [Burkholderia arboris]